MTTIRAADANPIIMGADRCWRNRMAKPFEALVIDIELRAEGTFVEIVFGALIDYGAFIAAEGISLRLILKKILSDFRSDIFKQKS